MLLFLVKGTDAEAILDGMDFKIEAQRTEDGQKQTIPGSCTALLTYSWQLWPLVWLSKWKSQFSKEAFAWTYNQFL